MDKDTALRLALEFVEANHSGGPDAFELIDIIKASLEAKDEPVAEIHSSTLRWIALEDHRPSNALLYTTPPQRTWVGLTDKDWNRSKHNQDFQKGVDWAEEMLKGKNT
jgi:hypothetical protein